MGLSRECILFDDFKQCVAPQNLKTKLDSIEGVGQEEECT